MLGIRIRSLVKSFGDFVAVDDISFDVAEGELVSLLGPSGCGKTTTLRCIAGLETGDQGTIQIGDTLVSDFDRNIVLSPDRRGIGMVFQSYAIWPHMSVFKNVAYPLVAQRVPKGEIETRVHETLKLVDMADFATRPATDLSGGQQQRVALARALIGNPSVLLLDEPLSNLDAMLRDQMRVELREIQQRTGITAVYVTHDQSEAMALSDRVIVMSNGRIEQIGTPREIYQSPATAFVAKFVGTSNLLRGETAGPADGDLVLVRLGGGEQIRVPDRNLSGSVTISLRPQFCETIPPADAPRDSGKNSLSGTIERITYFGERSEAKIAIGDVSLLVYLPLDTSFQVGDKAMVVFTPNACVSLQAQTTTDKSAGD